MNESTIPFSQNPDGLHLNKEVGPSWPRSVQPPISLPDDPLRESCGIAYDNQRSLKINDRYFAGRFLVQCPVLWEPSERSFYRYKTCDGVWHPMSESDVKTRIWKDLLKANDQTGIDDFVFQPAARLGGIIGSIRTMAERDAVFDSPPRRIFHCQNGMLDLGSSQPVLRGFHPIFFSRYASNIPFVPDAECPRFREFLQSAFTDEDTDMLQVFLGGVLLGENPAQRILILSGTAGSGKSSLVEIVEKVIGRKKVAQIRSQHLGGRFEMSKFRGKTLLTGKDVSADFLSNRSAPAIKALVGNDLLDMEKKHDNGHYQLQGSFNMVITANSNLRVRLEGDFGAWERRILLVHCKPTKPINRIANYADVLLHEEGSGILNWLVIGALRYISEVEQYGNIRTSEAHDTRVRDLLAESDSLNHFVKSQIVASPSDSVTNDELVDAYTNMCFERGWEPLELRSVQSSLIRLMPQYHGARVRHDIARGRGAKRGFKGVKLRKGGIE